MLEPEMDAFLRRVVPGIEHEWEGATEEEIGIIESMIGQELPRFYRWFLETMGHDAGPLDEILGGYAVDSVLTEYDDGRRSPGLPRLLIGHFDDPIMPLWIYYDLSRPWNDDAYVMSLSGGEWSGEALTLRELIAWSVLLHTRINPAPQRCRGRLAESGGDVYGALTRVLGELGFSLPVACGPYCLAAEHESAALACKVEAEEQYRDLLIFDLGGHDEGQLRRILGEIATRSSVEVTVTEWKPPLGGTGHRGGS